MKEYLYKKYGPTMDASEVADFFKVTPLTVRRWVNKPRRGFPVGVLHKGKRLFETEAIFNYFNELQGVK